MELSTRAVYNTDQWDNERQRLTDTKSPEAEDDEFFFQASELDRVQRRLKSRHVQMYVLYNLSSLQATDETHACRIAIAGTLGSGLFVSSGQVLSSAGPLGALMVYALVGSVCDNALRISQLHLTIHTIHRSHIPLLPRSAK